MEFNLGNKLVVIWILLPLLLIGCSSEQSISSADITDTLDINVISIEEKADKDNSFYAILEIENRGEFTFKRNLLFIEKIEEVSQDKISDIKIDVEEIDGTFIDILPNEKIQIGILIPAMYIDNEESVLTMQSKIEKNGGDIRLLKRDIHLKYIFKS